MSEERLAMIDVKVQAILTESKKRCVALLQKEEKNVRDIAVNLYKYDYLNKEEIDQVVAGKKLEKPNVREFDSKIDGYIVKF